VNGFVAPSADPGDLAAAIFRASARGGELRASTLEWFSRNADRLSLESSLARVVDGYAGSR
jgi:hypothetical protein